VQREIERQGRHWISTTVVHGRRFLRANVNSYHTGETHIRELVAALLRLLPPAGSSPEPLARGDV
jgi:aromatic-L-amino-acid decarboxylase